jgi:type IV secretory pathway VirJ component
MNRLVLILLALLFLVAPLYAQEVLQVPPFGDVHLYRSETAPKYLILFLSGDGGWNKAVDARSHALTTMQADVAGIDTTQYLNELTAASQACLHPANDFVVLSETVQDHLKIEPRLAPVLLGYSSGATLVYAMLIQSPPHTFAGAVSMGFCPDIEVTKPLCKGHGLEEKTYKTKYEEGFLILPSELIEDPWLVFQGDEDAVCSVRSVESYVHRVRNGEVIPLPKVGHGFRVTANWLPQFERAFHRFDHPASP